MVECLDQFRMCCRMEVDWGGRRDALVLEPIDPAPLMVPGVPGIDVGESRIVPVGEIDGSVWTGLGVDGAEPTVGGERDRV